MSLFKRKEFIIANGEVILTLDDPLLPARVSSQNDSNMIHISTPTSPTAGTFEAYVELVSNGGFHKAPIIGGTTNVINAANTGAQVADGDADAWAFMGSPYRIKIKAIGVTGVTSVFVVVSQNAG